MLPLVLPGLLVVAQVVERVCLRREGRDVAVSVERHRDRPPPDMSRDFHFPKERVLVLRATHQQCVNFPREEVAHLVVVTHQQDVGLLTPLIRLHDFLRSVGEGVGRAAASVDDTHDCTAPTGLEFHIMLHVPEVNEVRSSSLLGHEFDEQPDVDTLVLNVPTLMVVTRDELRCDTRTLGPVLDEVIHLVLKTERVDVRLGVPFALNHVPALVDRLDPISGPDVEQSVENVHPLVLRAEVVVRGDTERVGHLLHLGDVDDRRSVFHGNLVGDFHPTVPDVQVDSLRRQTLDSRNDLPDTDVELVRQGLDRPLLPRLQKNGTNRVCHLVYGILWHVRRFPNAVTNDSGQPHLTTELANVVGAGSKLLPDSFVVPHLPSFGWVELHVTFNLFGLGHFFSLPRIVAF